MNIVINAVVFLAFFVFWIPVGYSVIARRVKPTSAGTVLCVMIGLFLISCALYMVFFGAAVILAQFEIANNPWI